MATTRSRIQPRTSDKKSKAHRGQSGYVPGLSELLVITSDESYDHAAEAQKALDKSSRKAKTPNRRAKNVATKRQTEAEAGLDDIEVRTPEGTVIGTVGQFDPDDDAPVEAPRTSKAKASKPAQRPISPKGRAAEKNGNTSKVDATATVKAAKVKAENILTAAELRIKAKQDKAEAKIKADRDKVRAQEKARKEQEKIATAIASLKGINDDAATRIKNQARVEKKDLAWVKAEVKDAKAEAKRKEREAAAERRKLAKGETGDPEQDAIFHAAVDHATQVALVPASANLIAPYALGIPGVTLTKLGLNLPDNLQPQQWIDLTSGLLKVSDVSQFAIGDALVFGEDKYGKQYDVFCERLGIELPTVKGYKVVARRFKQDERVEGLSFSHHLEAAALYTVDPAKARNILQQALVEGKGKGWVREQVSIALNKPSAAQAKAEKINALVALSDAQFEADLISAGHNKAAVEKLQAAELETLVEYSQGNDEVPAPITLRVVSRLQGEIQLLRDEVAHWKALYASVAGEQAARDEANARILAAEAAYTAPADASDDGTDLSFLGNLDGSSDVEQEPTANDLADIEAGIETDLDADDSI